VTRIRVLKFGGSAFVGADRAEQAFAILQRELALGPIAVVVSAIGHTTDRLLSAARLASRGMEVEAEREVDAIVAYVFNEPTLAAALTDDALRQLDALIGELRKLLYGVSLLREHSTASLDLILSFGERIAAHTVSAVLASRQVPAMPVDARDLLCTSDRFGDALVDWERTAASIHAAAPAWSGKVPVITGFVGRAPDGRTTTLGRNGSDYTATLLARALDAAEVQFWSDVPGVMTADPALVDEAWPLARMTYAEALELATFGARVFHPRTMIPLMESGIPLRLRNTLEPDAAGTQVDAAGDVDSQRATCVTSLENQAMLDVQARRLEHHAGVAERVQSALARDNVPVWMMTQSAMGQAISAVVPMADADRAIQAIERALAPELLRGDFLPIGVQQPVTLLTLVAEAMGRTPNVAGRMFSALGNIGISVHAIGQSASSRSVSCVVHARDTRDAVRAVHAGFNLTHQRISMLVMGTGVVGAELIAQVRDQASGLRDRNDLFPVIVGLATSRRIVFDPEGLDPARASDLLADAPEVKHGPGGPVSPAVLDRLARLTAPVLVDCTGADGMESLYEAAFSRGIHVVAANKKPLTLPTAQRDALLDSARRHHRAYRYETTVGASLPVIETLQNLVQTGDTVELIEGSFSGTLGYLTNELMSGVPLDQAVRVAKELGYTEPLPQDDLSGLDVARKAIILARELGMQVELSDIRLTPLVPDSVLANRDLASFFQALSDYAPHMAQTVSQLREDGKVLRYLARVDPGAAARGEPALTVGPVGVPLDHPGARLRGSEAFVAFTTRRYKTYPLLVQGAGAGGAVTAAGVLADVLRIVATLRGR
jgi:aspartokinase/homoserine dehydrogenase 1